MSLKRLLKSFCVVFAATLALVAMPDNGLAQYETQTTPEEKAIFAFFRAAEQPPNYEVWIKTSPGYNNTPKAQQEKFFIEEQLRLGYGFGNFDARKDMLELTIDVTSKYTPAKDGKPANISFNFINNSKKKKSYIPVFNYDYGMDTMSLIINKLAVFSDLTLRGAQDKAVSQMVPYANDHFDATLQVHVRVMKADIENPITKGHKQTWLMVGDVAYIKCEYQSYYTQQKGVLWDYVAPWYEAEFKRKTMPEEEKYPHPFDIYKD